MARSVSSGVQFESDQPNSLDRQEGIRDGFNDAQKPPVNAELEADYAEQSEQGGRESEMVKDDAATHDMNPPPEIRAEQDRETFDAKWEAEQQNARDDLMADYADQVSDEQAHDHRKDRDWDMSL